MLTVVVQDGATVLHYASKSSCPDVVRLAAQHVDIAARDSVVSVLLTARDMVSVLGWMDVRWLGM